MLYSLIKNLSSKPSFSLQLAVEAQFTCASYKFLNLCYIITSCFLEKLYHRGKCYLIVKLKYCDKYILDISYILYFFNGLTRSMSMNATI